MDYYTPSEGLLGKGGTSQGNRKVKASMDPAEPAEDGGLNPLP